MTDSLVHHLVQAVTQLKLHHWQTTSYARHKAIDKFLKSYVPLLDRFVETYQGALGRRVQLHSHTMLDNDLDLDAYVARMGNMLEHVDLPSRSLDNLRDDMLALVQQLAYLCTLR